MYRRKWDKCRHQKLSAEWGKEFAAIPYFAPERAPAVQKRGICTSCDKLNSHDNGGREMPAILFPGHIPPAAEIGSPPSRCRDEE